MGELRLHKILVSGLLVGLIIVGLVLVIGNGAETYDVEADTSELNEIRNIVSPLTGSIEAYENQSSDLETRLGDPDVEGNIISQTATALKTTKNSVTIFSNLTTHTIGLVGPPGYSNYLITVLSAIIAIIILIGVFAAILLRFRG